MASVIALRFSTRSTYLTSTCCWDGEHDFASCAYRNSFVRGELLQRRFYGWRGYLRRVNALLWLLYHFILLWVFAPCFRSAQAFFCVYLFAFLAGARALCCGGKIVSCASAWVQNILAVFIPSIFKLPGPRQLIIIYWRSECLQKTFFFFFAFFLNPVSSLLMTLYGSLYHLYLLLRAASVASLSLNSLFKFILTSVFIYFLLLLRVNL